MAALRIEGSPSTISKKLTPSQPLFSQDIVFGSQTV